jgi:hypothetical protein
MKSQAKETAQRWLAILVIVAMLYAMGIPASVVFFFAVVTYFIWRAVQRSEQQETGRIFEFYIAASEILRDEEQRWFGFEIAEVIARGEHVLHSMTDPPPLVYFALGALYNRAGNHEGAAEHLAYVVENEMADERFRLAPSPELRRYVQVLRRLEREPAEAPQTMAAIRTLERARRTRAATLLADSRAAIEEKARAIAEAQSSKPALSEAPPKEAVIDIREKILQNPPPPIAEVLRDVYEEDKGPM